MKVSECCGVGLFLKEIPAKKEQKDVIKVYACKKCKHPAFYVGEFEENLRKAIEKYHDNPNKKYQNL